MLTLAQKFSFSLIVLTLGFASAVRGLDFEYLEFEILTLPVWRYYEAEEDTAGYYPGGGLWPEGTLPKKGGIAHVVKADEEFRKARLWRKYPSLEPKEGGEEVQVPIPKVRYLASETDEILPELPSHESVAEELPELTAAEIDELIGQKPEQMLIDPQGLINGQRANDIMRFLEFHSEQAKFQIYALVLGENQQLPESVNLDQVHEDWFAETKTALLIYHQNAPLKTRVILGQKISVQVEPGFVYSLIENSIAGRMESEDSADQLEKIAIELSIQLFGLESHLNRPKTPVKVEEAPLVAAEFGPQNQPIEAATEPTEFLFPLTTPIEPIAFEQDPKLAKWSNAWASVAGFFKTNIENGRFVKWIVTCSCIVLGLAVCWLFWNFLARRRAEHQPSYHFPACTPQQRLGGQYCGGTFIEMSFNLDDSE